MGNNVNISLVAEFITKDDEESEKIVVDIYKDLELEIPDEIFSRSSYINLPNIEGFTFLYITMSSSPNGWEDICVEDGNFGLVSNTLDNEISFSELQVLKDNIQKLAEKIKEKYKCDYIIKVVGTYC